MPIGTLNRYDSTRGFGFLRADDASRNETDVFVHIYELQRAGIENPLIGEAFEYSIGTDTRSGKQRATDVARLMA